MFNPRGLAHAAREVAAGPLDYTAIGAASSPVFSCDGRALFHLRGAGLALVWALRVEHG